MKRNILLVTDIFPRWQDDAHIPAYVADLAKSLSAYYGVYVLVPHTHCAALHEYFDSVTVIRFRYFYPFKWQLLSRGSDFIESARDNFIAFLQIPFYIISELISLIKIMRKHRIDVINSHGFMPHALVCSLVSKLFKKPHVMTLHGPGISAVSQWGSLGKMLSRFCLNNTKVTLPVSIYTRYSLEKLCARPFDNEIIPMGVDLDTFTYVNTKFNIHRMHGIPKDHKIVLFVGELVERHGVQVLLEAVQSLRNDYQHFTLLIIGGGHLEQLFKKWVNEQGLFDHVQFLGWIDHDQIPQYYASSDMVVVPLTRDALGETDGLPVVILESFAAGVPVIASQISGISDVVRHGYNGWLFEHGNAGDLYARLELFLSSDKLTLSRMKKNALKTAKDFSWESVAERYYNHIRECIPIKK